MQRLKQILDEIQLIEDSYKISLSSDEHTRQQKAEQIYRILGEVLNAKKFFDEKDIEMIETFDFSRFEEIEILKKSYMTLKEMREIADLHCCVIIPISYTSYIPENKKIKEMADSLGMKTYVITALKNYDVWKEIICSQEVGGKFFPEKYMQVLLTIELLIGTQKNFYEMVKDNKNKINLLRKSFNENMRSVQKVLIQIDNNQERLKKQSDYLLERVINEKMREHENIKQRILEKDKVIRHQEYLGKLEEVWEKHKLFRFPDGTYIMYKHARPPKEPEYEYYEDYHEVTKKALKEYEVSKQTTEKVCEEIKEMFKLEDVEKFEFIELRNELSFIIETQKELEDNGSIIFHSFSVDPMNDNCIVFLNK